jgi:protein-S-isoprenylcysteine O-methyltransferase Ste14
MGTTEKDTPMEGRLYVFTALQIVIMLALLWFLITWSGPWNWERYVGSLLVVVGAGFIVAARLQLGKSFSLAPKAKRLVTAGLYSKIRNPIYVFGSLLFAGFILVVERPILWILLIVLVIAQTIRAQREARVLEDAFGDEYREYLRKTWF